MLLFQAMDPKLEALRAGYSDSVAKDLEGVSTDIPFITETTFLTLAHELNLPVDLRTQNILRGLTGEPNFSSFYLGRNLATHEFKAFPASTRDGFLFQVQSWLKDSYDHPVLVNASTVGMAVVLRAFHLQEGGPLIDALAEIPGIQAMRAFQKTTRTLTKESGIVKRLMSGQNLPEYQIYLNEAIHLMKLVSPQEAEIEEGAIAMYRALEALWPAIKDPSKRETPKLY